MLKVNKNGKITTVTVEKWENTAEGSKNSIEGIAKALGVDTKDVIEALRKSGNYKGKSDEEIAKNLKVGETLVIRDGKVMIEKEAKKIMSYAGDILSGLGIFIGGVANGVGDLAKGIKDTVAGLLGIKKQYSGVNVTGINDPNYFWTPGKIPQNDEEWNKLVGTYRYWINYYQEKGMAFCKIWTVYQAAMRGIYLPTVDRGANAAVLAIQGDQNFAEISRLSDGSLDHQKAVNMAKDGYFVMALFYNSTGQGHMAVVMPYGYDGE